MKAFKRGNPHRGGVEIKTIDLVHCRKRRRSLLCGERVKAEMITMKIIL